jgi:hypothetical protein
MYGKVIGKTWLFGRPFIHSWLYFFIYWTVIIGYSSHLQGDILRLLISNLASTPCNCSATVSALTRFSAGHFMVAVCPSPRVSTLNSLPNWPNPFFRELPLETLRQDVWKVRRLVGESSCPSPLSKATDGQPLSSREVWNFGCLALMQNSLSSVYGISLRIKLCLWLHFCCTSSSSCSISPHSLSGFLFKNFHNF